MRFKKIHAICTAILTASVFALAPCGVSADEVERTILPSGAVTGLVMAVRSRGKNGKGA